MLLLLLAGPLPARDYGESNLQKIVDSLQLKEPYQTEALFENVASGTLGPEVADRYSPQAALFFGIYAKHNEHLAAAERFLAYAAAKPDTGLHRHAEGEYLQLLGRLGKWQDLVDFFEAGRTGEPDSLPAVVEYVSALWELERFDRLAAAMERYREPVAKRASPELQARFLLLEVKLGRRTGRPEWSKQLLELIIRFPREELPLELFIEEGDTNLVSLQAKLFSESERNLLQAKYAYGRSDYGSSFAHYHEFMRAAAGRYDLLSKVITDEFALSGLYSGRTWDAYADAEQVRRSLAEIEALGEKADAERALFWMLETEGYLSRRLGRFSMAEGLYRRALKIAPETERQRMLWYIFDCLFRSNTAEAVSRLPELASEWDDPSYFTDVVYNLIDRLVSRRQWEQVAEVADALEVSSRGVAGARAAYIAGRAAESGLLTADEQQIRHWFQSAMRSSWGTGAGLYYRLMAAAALERYGVTTDVMQPADFCRLLPIQSASSGVTRSWQAREQDALIDGYVKFGLAAEAYRRWGSDREYVDGLQLPTVRRWAAALQVELMYLESIRMLSRYCLDTRAEMSAADVKLLYPAAYAEFVEPLSSEHELPAHLFYALVREESLFDAEISSAAGAVGLGQLMPSTAEDVAGRIGVRVTDLTDPHLNLRLGSWYLAHLMDRTENVSQALFAYNGGITRVRRWVRQSDGLDGDLVLELIPFQETSHYGRKVLVAAAMYGYFYRDIELNKMVDSFF